MPAPRHDVHTLLAVLTMAAGLLLLAYMVAVESEPGAVPLLLIVVGIGWLIYARARLRAQP